MKTRWNGLGWFLIGWALIFFGLWIMLRPVKAAQSTKTPALPKGKYTVTGSPYSFGPIAVTGFTQLIIYFERVDVTSGNEFSGSIDWFDGTIWRFLWGGTNFPPGGIGLGLTPGSKLQSYTVINVPPLATQLRGQLIVTKGVVDTKIDVEVR
jgi:hypothetical protein